MRITRDALMKIVGNTVTQRTRADRGLISIYMCGSLLGEDYMLGGTADIDLVFIHTDSVPVEREIVHLTDEITMDIAHHYYRDYRQTRRLRLDPWLGPTIYTCNILYDPQHFMDFTQASVRGQYYRADYVLERARRQADQARQIWFSFRSETPQPGPQAAASYLRSVGHAANAIAGLSGHPLTERRFLLKFPDRAASVGRPGLNPGLLGLLGAPNVDAEIIRSWLPSWQSAYQALSSEAAPPRLHPYRLAYYRRAFEVLLDGGHPQAALWPLQRTWTLAVEMLPETTPERAAWNDAFQKLGLLGPVIEERMEALDAYLDLVEETLENWARQNGVLL